MTRDSIVNFGFQGIYNKDLVIKENAKGFESMHHAEMWGHHRASMLSDGVVSFYLSTILVDSNNFVCLASPEYYNEGVTFLS